MGAHACETSPRDYNRATDNADVRMCHAYPFSRNYRLGLGAGGVFDSCCSLCEHLPDIAGGYAGARGVRWLPAGSEERTFEFTDDVNGVYWEIPLGQNQQGENVTLSINGVSVDGDEFQEADYASSGDYGVYTVDTSGSSVTLKIFMPSSDGSSADVEISYTMSGAVMLWQDTAELYWKFVGDGWGGKTRTT